MKNLTVILLLCMWITGGALSAHAGDRVAKTAVLLEIEGGDTDFVVDDSKNEAWWVKGSCKVPIPLEKQVVSQKNNNKTISSKKILDRVKLGSRQVTLEQQFRFNLSAHGNSSAKVEVYNSLRGGWSPVPVRLRANCALDVSCRARMDVPQC